MKKTIVYTLFVVIICLISVMSIGGFAETTVYTPAEWFEFSQGIITGYTGTDTDVVVPPAINGESVTSIGDYAFQNKSDITSITLPNTIERIGYRAFYRCTSVRSVNIPENVTDIEDSAFYYCTALTEINWNAKNVADFSYGNYVFAYAGQDGVGINVVFGNGVESIPARAFYPDSGTSYVPKVIKVTIGENVSDIGGYAFYNCTALTEINWNAKNVADFSYKNYVFANAGQDGEGINVVFGDGVESIPAYAFCPYSNDSSYTPNVVNVTIGENVKSIGSYAFRNCSSLNQLTIGENVSDIGDYAFYNCTALTEINWNAKNAADFSSGNCVFAYAGQDGEGISVVFGDGVESIPAYAFCPYSNDSSYTPNVVNVTVGENVANIGEYAFFNLRYLESINIPAKLTTFPEISMTGWKNIKIISVDSGHPYYSSDEYGVLYNNDKSVLVRYPSKIETDKFTIPESVDHISDQAFYHASNLSELTINHTLTSIGSDVFTSAGKDNSLKVNLGKEAGTLPLQFFYSMGALTEINVSDENNTYSSECGVLYSKDGTKLVQYPPVLTETEFVIPDDVTEIGTYAFYNAKNLTSLTVGKKVSEIGSYAFCGCTSLTSLYWNAENVNSLGYNNEVFRNVGKDGDGVSVVFGDSVKTIPDYIFNTYYNYNPKVISISIGRGVDTIGSTSFANCSTIEKIEFGENVKYIGKGAFSGTAYYNSSSNWENNLLYLNNCLIGARSVSGVYTVKEGTRLIAGGVFDGCTNLSGINLPDGIEYINSRAFYGCSGLKTLTLPESLLEIGSSAFYGCSSYSSLTIPESVAIIGASAFYNCSSLSHLTVEENVGSIGDNAFYNCTSLAEINWNAKRTEDFSQGSYIFANAGKNGDGIKVVFGDSVEKIPGRIFYPYNSYGSYEYPTKIISVDMGENVKSIGEYAFYNCQSMIELTIGENVESVGNYAFYGCSGITSLTIPESVTIIGASAFYNCSSLSHLTVGENVGSIGDNAFYNCTSLAEINWNAKRTEDFSQGSYIFANAGKNGGGIKVVFGDSVEKIPGRIFYPCNSYGSYGYPTKIISVDMGENVKSIGDYAFYNCQSMIELTIGENVESVGNYAFYGCSGITSLTIPESVTIIGASALYNCSSLSHLTVGENVSDIGNSAFYNCSNLNAVYITSLEKYMQINFGDAYSDPAYYAANVYFNGEVITDVVIPDGVTVIPSFVKRSSAIKSLTVPGSVQTIDNSFFINCTNLKKIVLKDGITTIGNEAFYNCSSLESLTVPQSVKTVGSNAFYGLTSLKELNWNAVEINEPEYYNENAIFTNAGANTTGVSVTFGDGVKTIPKNMFYVQENSNYVSNIVSVSISDSVTTIGERAFYNCSSLGNLTVPQSVKTVGSNAFYGLTSLTELNWNAVEINEPEYYNGNAIFTNAGANTTGVSVSFGNGVKTIPGNMFYVQKNGNYVSNIVSVSISDSVTTIGSQAFYNCSSLESLTIPQNIKTIGNNAFYGLTALTELNWNAVSINRGENSGSESLFSNVGANGDGLSVVFGEKVKSIPAYMFNSYIYGDYVSKVRSVVISDSVTEIGDYAFYNCGNMTELTFGKSITDIGNEAFAYCSGITSAQLPDALVNIGREAFLNCTSLVSLTVPENVEYIGDRAFSNLASLETLVWNAEELNVDDEYGDDIRMYDAGINGSGLNVIFGDKVRKIPAGIFASYDYEAPGANVVSVVIPGSVEEIGASAFYNCKNLTELSISQGVKKIGNSAFEWCESLEELCIPESVTTVGYEVFGNLTSLKKLVWNPVKISNVDGEESCSFYNAGSNTDGLEVIFGDRVESIPYNMFRNDYEEYNTNVTSVYMSDSIKKIGEGAFYGCTGLTELILGNGVEYIGDSAFENCTSLKTLTVPENVKTIEYGAFDKCTSLEVINWNAKDFSLYDYDDNSYHRIFREIGTEGNGVSVIFGSKVESISPFLFSECASVNNVSISDSVKTIGMYAFEDCSSLESITIGNGVERIGYYAFYGSAYYNNGSNWENNVLYIGNYLIEAKRGLRGEYGIEYGTRAIADQAFVNGRITSVSIPDSVVSIGDYAFKGCTSLKKINIPDSVRYLGAYAFYENEYITEAKIGRGISCINESTFANCWDLKTVAIPKSVTTIKANAFSGDSYITYVEYGGNDAEWNDIVIEAGNDYLKSASFKYNRELPVTVFYNTNGGTDAPDIEKANENTSVIITSDIPCRDGYTFLGWSEDAKAVKAKYAPGDSLALGTGDVTLYAVWKLIVDFDVEYTNGIIVVVPTRVPIGSNVILAMYKDGNLSGFKNVPFDGKASVVPFMPDSEFDTIKIMVWGDFSEISPLCTEKIPEVENKLTAFQIMAVPDSEE